jgi:hypothetical protein
MNTAGAPECDHIGLADQHDLVGKVAQHVGGFVSSIGAVHDHISVMAYQQIKQPCKLGSGRGKGCDLADASQKV